MLSNLLMKWFGPSFLIKHRTTLTVFIAGLLGKLPLVLPPDIAEKFSASFADILILAGAYLLSFKVDLENKQK